MSLSHADSIGGKAAIVGIGATEFSKESGRSELQLACEAVKAALTWAVRDWGRTHVRAWRLDENQASDAVLVKAGFLYTGERRQTFVTSRGEALPSRGMMWLA